MDKLAAFLQGFMNSMRLLSQIQAQKQQNAYQNRLLDIREKLTKAQIEELGARTIKMMLDAQAEQSALEKSKDVFNTAYNMYLKQGLQPEEAKLRAYYVANNWVQQRRLENGVASDMITGKLMKTPTFKLLAYRIGSEVAKNYAQAQQSKTGALLNLAKIGKLNQPDTKIQATDTNKDLLNYLRVAQSITNIIDPSIKNTAVSLGTRLVLMGKPQDAVNWLTFLNLNSKNIQNEDDIKTLFNQFIDQNTINNQADNTQQPESNFQFKYNPMLNFNLQQTTTKKPPKTISTLGVLNNLFSIYNPRQLGQQAYKQAIGLFGGR